MQATGQDKNSRAIAILGRYLGFLWLSLCLSGCIRYDLGINYQGQHRGEIVQQLHLDDSLTRFGYAATQAWLEPIEHRAKTLGGRLQHQADETITITIPFNNGAELETKFNQFFQPNAQAEPTQAVIDLPEITAHLRLHESNFLLLLRNQLEYEVDLRSLGVLSADGSPIVDSGSFLNAQFHLTTPWGAHRLDAILSPASENPLLWQLKPGEINRLNAVFWVPSSLGIGTVVIMLLVAIGIYLRP